MEEKNNINRKGWDSILLPFQFLNASDPNTMTVQIWPGSIVNKWVPCDTRQYFQVFHKLRKTSLLLLWHLQTNISVPLKYVILTCQNNAKRVFDFKCNWMLERCSFDFKFVWKLFLKVKSQRKYETEMWTQLIKLTVSIHTLLLQFLIHCKNRRFMVNFVVNAKLLTFLFKSMVVKK